MTHDILGLAGDLALAGLILGLAILLFGSIWYACRR